MDPHPTSGPWPCACRLRAMTRCECAAMPFAEIARRMRERSESLAEVQRATGCGLLCTACVPDLVRHLASCEDLDEGEERPAFVPACEPA